MPDSKGLSRRRFLLGVASTAATSCLPLSGAAILTGDLTPALAAQNTTVRESREAVSPAPVIVVNSGYRLLIDSVRGTIASFRSTYGVNRELLIRDHARLPLFNIEFMNDRSEFKLLASTEAKKIAVRKDEHEKDQTVTIEYKEIGELPVDGIVTIRRGYRTKVQHGWLPGLAPLGYLNDKAAKTIIADPERFPLVQQMWRLMLTGAYSPRRIWEIATKDWGLCTVPRKRIGGNPITLSAVYRVLTNSFYAGVLEREGQTFPGKHPPMITLDEFAHVRAVMSRSGRPRQTRSFSYTGMIRCGECGFSVTGEEKVNRFGSHYTYYHAANDGSISIANSRILHSTISKSRFWISFAK